MRVTRTGKATNTNVGANNRNRDSVDPRTANQRDRKDAPVSNKDNHANPGKQLTTQNDAQAANHPDTHSLHLDPHRKIHIFRSNSAFVAHLIAVKENAPHLRKHRRVEPKDGITSYLTTARAPRKIGEGRIIEYHA
ncbi:hypothetical protein PsAD2_00355 [Pseudovibrio axinellae]|uniref:Uncharacterized protein n=1 Tax=Pseudovibrio axinellae TaxID=989403 RepID=A0A166AYZ1_9HYPH|nr:hypothetical protein [Pseudovibrio axinellae]KZL21731.1 hypothetical protein PsAD2_00355 [Pseudovibrio axinellae]SEQ21252.1 hypothetical protein SAMN05421798_102147 [Pseudovibrio axinellae]